MQPGRLHFYVVRSFFFLNASFCSKAQISDASFQILRKFGFADYICLTYFKICQTYFFQSPGPFLKVPTPMYINGDAHAAMNGFL